MTVLSTGAPPSTIRDYVEDMLNELAELADRVEEPRLSAAIRSASVIAAETNAKEWLVMHRQGGASEKRR